jgi:hypothetical protein
LIPNVSQTATSRAPFREQVDSLTTSKSSLAFSCRMAQNPHTIPVPHMVLTLRSLLGLSFVILLAAGCHHSGAQLRVVGGRHEVVFVEVRNPSADRAMQLTKLEYKFAADGGTVAQGEVPLDEREVPAGAAVIVEVPLDTDTSKPVTLTGTLTARLDEIVRNFSLSAQIQPH